ncbi:MAG: M48 family metalloprotease [Zoogloeaceae bacterium]|nr:M48 family metalloprotease [Zoogloeaceae bacterium]
MFCLVLAIFVFFSVAGGATELWEGANDLPELGDAADVTLSLAQEKKIGREIMQEIRAKDASYLNDPETEAYLNQIGRRLADASPDPSIGFYFFPLSDPTLNAFATFGGYVGVHSGLILAVRDESELAGVLAHEISHVTQRHLARGLSKSQQLSGATLLATAIAILAAHSRPELVGAAVTGAAAGAMQTQLGYSRDFEREADRIGLQTLLKAGFDARGMSSFFARLQRATRLYENQAPVYLRTHPLTLERVSDMQNREARTPYRQRPDSLEFHLIRARLEAMRQTPEQSIALLRERVKEQKSANVDAARYGLAVAYARQKNWQEAERLLADLRAKKLSSPIIDRLYAEVKVKGGDTAGGLALFREAIARNPGATALIYSYAECLMEARQLPDARRLLEQSAQKMPENTQLYRLLARAYALSNMPAAEHQALGDAYAREGNLHAAIEQMELARKMSAKDFYRSSIIDERLRQLKKERQDEGVKN